MSSESGESELLHRFKNKLYVAAGFCELLLLELNEDDPHRTDLLQMQQAMQEAMALVPEIAERLTP
jgi:hypothetical protein